MQSEPIRKRLELQEYVTIKSKSELTRQLKFSTAMYTVVNNLEAHYSAKFLLFTAASSFN